MADWQSKLNLNDVYHAELPIRQLAGIVASRLRNVSIPDAYEDLADERDDIADEFEGLSEDKSADVDDFDCVMSRLYDWADSSLDGHWNGKKLCWVATV